MTDCTNAQIRDLLPDVLHGTLAESDKMRVLGHLAECSLCMDELELLSAVYALPGAPMSGMGTTAPIATPRRRARMISMPLWAGLAAGISLVALGGASYGLLNSGIYRLGAPVETTYVELGDSLEQSRLSEMVPNLFAYPDIGDTLDEQAIREILSQIETMDGLLSDEPRPLVHNLRIAGDL